MMILHGKHINTTYAAAHGKECVMYVNEGRELQISSIDSPKKTIILSDNSKWELTGVNSFKTAIWTPENTVIVRKSGNHFQMINHNKKTMVRVKQIS